MSEVKWIKLSTSMFEDEKIRLLEGMPEADSMLVIWIKLLSQAGKTNASGYIFLNENIPYTDEMLATIFNRPLNVVRMALNSFVQFGMITIDEKNFISITNWEKHQNIASLDKIREDTKKRVQRYRDKQKLIESNEDCNVTSRYSNALRSKKEEEEKEYIVEIVNYLNQATNKSYKTSTRKTKDLIRARCNEGFTLDDFKQVIDIKCSQWLKDPNMVNYLRPETLFGTKFESYLNEKPSMKKVTKEDFDLSD